MTYGVTFYGEGPIASPADHTARPDCNVFWDPEEIVKEMRSRPDEWVNSHGAEHILGMFCENVYTNENYSKQLGELRQAYLGWISFYDYDGEHPELADVKRG
jgi:hypothetical protein